MPPDTERAGLALFEAMLERPEAERDAWLRDAAGDRPDVLARVEAMRAADRETRLRTGGAIDEVEDAPPPERIGAYRIAERIGRGGMGSVYRAERATGDFRHVVAIKIIKPGLLSEALVERFQRERQTLAQLAHPHIARLYDGGEIAGGSPYIVMEYVDGLPLLEHVAAGELDRAARRRLFLDICDAVAAAHRSLIVHRDLTPSNVLVTRDGMVKLIDFGIAREAEDEAAGEDMSGRPSIASLSLTPGYAAPERMTGAPVTTAADIYSLGKLLARLIPPGPGDRELKAIIARATADDPAARYSSADALREDVVAWADGFPVAAVGGGRGYVAGKFVARRRLAVAASALAIALLIGALVAALVANARAERALVAEKARFGQVRSLASYLLFDLNTQLARTAGNVAARGDLARQAQRYLNILSATPNATPELRLETAQGLIRLARIQGVPSEPNLGEFDLAKTNLASADRILAGLDTLPDARTVPPRAELLALRAFVLLHSDMKAKDTDALLSRAQTLLDTIPPPERQRPWTEAQRLVRRAALEAADLNGRYDDVPTLAAALERDIAAWPAAARTGPEAAFDRATARYFRALTISMTGKPIDSIPDFLSAERQFAALHAAAPDDPAKLYMSAWNDTMGYGAASAAGREDVSNRLITNARAKIDRLLAIESRDNAVFKLAAIIKEAQAQNLRDLDRFDEAIALQSELVTERRRRIRPDSKPSAYSDLAFSESILGIIGKDAGDRALACASWARAEAGYKRLQARSELLAFHAAFLPGIRANLEKCEAGAPIAAFGPLRS